MSRCLRGIPVSPGIAIGPAWFYNPSIVAVEFLQVQDPGVEIARFNDAIKKAKDQISSLYLKSKSVIGVNEAAIFEAHKLFLDDPEFIQEITDLISTEQINAESAVDRVISQFAQKLYAIQDEYFRARAQDIRDIGRRILCCLAGINSNEINMPDRPVIILAEDLTPSDTMQFERDRILGLCTSRGGPTSHTAILARSLGIPAVVNLSLQLSNIHEFEQVILDGNEGILWVDPTPEEIERADNARKNWAMRQENALSMAHLPAMTQDGHVIEVAANIGNIEDAKHAIAFGADGVGLFRTEFLYLNRQQMPLLEEQIEVYKQIFGILGRRPVVVRTLDIGGDKAVDYLGIKNEPNPFLGWRAIRMIDERPDILRDQFSALLQAGIETDLRIMVPMVSSIEEVEHARQLLDQARDNLIRSGVPFADAFQFGIMVEIPSAALLAESLADYVDFFSIGTNDLTQYALAVDRTNERVAHLASPFHPVVIQLIAITIQGAHAKGKWVGLCGEMAGDPLATPLLIGLGLDEFSMAPASIPLIKQNIRQLSANQCREIANHALDLKTTEAVKSFLRSLKS